MDVILTHENADFDAVAGLLAVARLNPEFIPVISDRLNQNVERFLTLYGSGFPFVRSVDIRSRTIGRVLLVDAQRLPHLKHLHSAASVQVIDHHPANDDLSPSFEFTYEVTGAITTYLVEQIQAKDIHINSLEATLFMLGIYEDTGSLSYGTTTSRDLKVAAWLMDQHAVLDTVRRFLSHPLNQEQQNLLELLLQRIETRSVQGYAVSLSAVTVTEYISEVSAAVHRLRDLLDSSALFVVVTMPTGTLLVARSVVDAIDVSVIARLLGGGGHARASAATIHNRTQDEIVDLIWRELDDAVVPVSRVADLMSYGAQTVDATQPLNEVIRRLRQIGHEGYPVLDGGKIVGLLTRRDLDRADEHKLRDLRVQDVMTSGTVTVTRDTAIFELERLLLESGWGQIPVVDERQQLIGIVTRTDLLKYWVRTHPSSNVVEQNVTLQKLVAMLGQRAAFIVQQISEHAQATGIELYMVGGVVRDLLLGRANFDIDFVVEGDAISFAQSIHEQFGGDVNIFKPFGTAKWKPQGGIIEQSSLLSSVDFASSRYEFYEHPAALPTVYNSSIKLDLQRRDFTINTLAIQLSPMGTFGRIIDFYGGLRDIDRRLIRVLHSLSFIDDPTRILRAMRFKYRLDFEIESRTKELMNTALPMLGRTTGERLRNELTLLLQEDQPERCLSKMQEWRILQSIHNKFYASSQMLELFKVVREEAPHGLTKPSNISDLYWHIWAAFLTPDELGDICQRLLFGRKMAESMQQVSSFMQHLSEIAKPEAKSSTVFTYLESLSEIAVVALWYIVDSPLIKQRIELYWGKWRHIQPITTGTRLQTMGLQPGKCYGIILRRLREAWIDDNIHNENEEMLFLKQLLLDERICDGMA